MSNPQAVPCPQCGQQTQVDFDRRYRPFRCDACTARFHYKSLENPPALNSQQIRDAEIEGVLDSRGQSTVCFIKHRKKPPEACSSTLVQIGEHLFLATASHCIPENGADSKLLILPKRGAATAEGGIRISAVQKSPTASVDVGLIELDRADQARMNGYTPIELKDIEDIESGGDIVSCTAIGYPRDYAQLIGQRSLAMHGIGVIGIVAPADCFESLREEVGKADRNLHCLCWFDKDQGVMRNKADSSLTDQPDPYGLSGGGHWSIRTAAEEDIWSPNHSKLFAIQSLWPKKDDFLLGVQIAWWLKLVCDHYPDIASEIHKMFPRVESLSWPTDP